MASLLAYILGCLSLQDADLVHKMEEYVGSKIKGRKDFNKNSKALDMRGLTKFINV